MCWSTTCAGWSVAIAALLETSAMARDQVHEDLGGIGLRCCVVRERPYVFEERGKLSGLAIKYLRDLEEELNFKCKSLDVYDGDDEGSRQGFSGFKKYLDDCAVDGDSSRCKCDLAASGFVKTPARLSRVDFADPFATDSFSVAQRTEEIVFPKSKLFFVEPFTLAVWAGVVSLILGHSFVTIFDKHFKPPEKNTAPPADASKLSKIRHILLKTKLLRRIRYAFLQTSKHMVGAETDDRIRTERRSIPVRQHFLHLGAILMGVFLTLSYEASLVTHLSGDVPVSIFRSMEDVKNCRLDATDFCIPKGGASEDFWKFAINASRATCRTKSADEDQPQIIEAHANFRDPSSAGLNAVATKECKFLLALTSTVAVATEGKYCNTLSVVGDPFIPTTVSFVLPKGSNLTGYISAATVRFQQQDTLMTPIKYGVHQECNGAKSNRLNWSRLGFFFYFSWICLLVMFVYMLIDKRRDPDGIRREEGNSEESDSVTIDSTAALANESI